MEKKSFNIILKKKTFLLLLLILGIGLFLRLYFFAGYLLIDDGSFFDAYSQIYEKGEFHHKEYSYRIGLWIPVTVLWKIFGISEFTFNLWILISSMISIVLVYLILKELYNPKVGLIGALLMAVNPFDMAFSTTFNIDIVLSMFMAAAFLFFIKARKKNYKFVYFLLSSFFILIAIYTKITGVYMLGVLGILTLFDYKNAKRYLKFYLSFVIMFLISVLVLFILTGNPLIIYNSEVGATPSVYPVGKSVLMTYISSIFFKNPYGIFSHGFYGYIFLLSLVFAIFFIKKNQLEVMVYSVAMFLMIEFMPHRLTEYVTALRWERYITPVVLPFVLMIASTTYLLGKKSKRITYFIFSIFIVISVIQCIELGSLHKDIHSDYSVIREFINKNDYDYYLMGSKQKIFADRFTKLYHSKKQSKVLFTTVLKVRKDHLEKLNQGSIVFTGGATIPYSGNPGLNINIEKIKDVTSKWKLLYENKKEITAYRKEPLRIWVVKK